MYKFCDPVAQKVVIRLDVVFNEKSMINIFKEEKSQAAKSSNNISRYSLMNLIFNHIRNLTIVIKNMISR
jgi:hypothetical protein